MSRMRVDCRVSVAGTKTGVGTKAGNQFFAARARHSAPPPPASRCGPTPKSTAQPCAVPLGTERRAQGMRFHDAAPEDATIRSLQFSRLLVSRCLLGLRHSCTQTRTYTPLSYCLILGLAPCRAGEQQQHWHAHRVHGHCGPSGCSPSSSRILAGEHLHLTGADGPVLGQIDHARHDGAGLEGQFCRLGVGKCERTGELRL